MPRTRSTSRASASHPRTDPITPSGRSVACTTTAAAPSPKSTATLRLLQSMYCVMSSTPITIALRIVPFWMSAVAVESPYRKLVQAVFTSIAPAFVAPSATCTPDAQLGTASSFEQLPYTIRSTSAGSSPAHASARDAATVAISIAGTCETRRSFMPVRVVIHSSVVSRNVARSALVRTAGGRPSPQPVMDAYVMRARFRVTRCYSTGTQISVMRCSGAAVAGVLR